MTQSATSSPSRSHAPVPRVSFQDNAVRAFIRTYGLLDRVMSPFFARFGISGAQWGVLRALYRAETEGSEALSVTELSDRLVIRPPSVTGVIDRMVREELVTRQTMPTDMRVKQIRLTDKARLLIEGLAVALDDQMVLTLSGLTKDEQGELQRLLTVMGRHLEGMVRERVTG